MKCCEYGPRLLTLSGALNRTLNFRISSRVFYHSAVYADLWFSFDGWIFFTNFSNKKHESCFVVAMNPLIDHSPATLDFSLSPSSSSATLFLSHCPSFPSFSLLSVCFFLLLSTTSHLSPYLLLSFLNFCKHLLISTLSPSSLTLWLFCPVHFSLYLSLSLPFTLSKHRYLRHNT